MFFKLKKTFLNSSTEYYKERQAFGPQGETVYTFHDLSNNLQDKSELDKTIQVEQPEVIQVASVNH